MRRNARSGRLDEPDEDAVGVDREHESSERTLNGLSADAEETVTRTRRALEQRSRRGGLGNGGCSDDGASSRSHLLEIASHGYLVIASLPCTVSPISSAQFNSLHRTSTV